MPRTRRPRAGSMQFWPKTRAHRMTARVRTWHSVPKKLSGFPAYKAGMTHIQFLDNNPNSLTKGAPVASAVTVLECPPVKVIDIRAYKNTYTGSQVAWDVLGHNLGNNVARSLSLPKSAPSLDGLSLDGVTRITVLVATQPHLIQLKKTPEVIELAVHGKTPAEQLATAKDLFGKEVTVDQIIAEGEQVDIHSITKGKGNQGPVKRFGIHLKFHKSEKGRRAPGSIAPWHGVKNWMSPHQGQMGFHQRTELNKWVMKIGKSAEEVNPKGGFLRYGLVAGTYMLVKGSVGGAKKRLVTLTPSYRPRLQTPKKAPAIVHISRASKQ